jgi:hypothetical protein
MIEVIRGDSKVINVTFTDEGDTYDISGGKVFFTVNELSNPEDDDKAVIALDDSDDQITITNAAEGEVEISLEPSDTEIVPSEYFYDVQLVDAAGNITSRKQYRTALIL